MALADQTFGFFIPTVSLMGVGCSKEAGVQAKALGASNLLIVTDAGLSKMGVAGQIKAQLEEAGLKAVIFDGAEPNPTDTNVHDGVKAYQENKCDGIVTLGGGSSHDCGKGIGLSSATAVTSATSKGSTNRPSRCPPSSPSTPPPAPLPR
jgi:alcohol dehydrogenase